MKVKLIALVALVLVSISCTVPVQAGSWQKYTTGGIHEAEWTGDLKFTGIFGNELWIETAFEDGTYARMIILWSPTTQRGRIFCFTHHGEWFWFTGWSGTIEYDSGTGEYDWYVSGRSIGSYQGRFGRAFIIGWYDGTWIPIDPANPMQGAMSISDWEATIIYYE